MNEENERDHKISTGVKDRPVDCISIDEVAAALKKIKRQSPRHDRARTCIHTFNGLFSRTTWVSRHQKGKPFWILLKQEMMGWQWHQLDHMQIICTTLKTGLEATMIQATGDTG